MLAVLGVALGLVWAPAPTAAEVAAVLLDVPWRTQIDGHPDQRGNAGLACLSMVLAAYAQDSSIAELRAAHDLQEGRQHSPVTLASLARLANANGLQAQPVRSSGEVRLALEAGRPVLLSLGPSTPPQASERWVVAVGYTARGGFIYDDPAWPVAEYGQQRVLTTAEDADWLGQGATAASLWLGAPRPSTPRSTAAPTDIADGSPEWWHRIEVFADWFGVDPFFVAAVALAESGGDPGAVGDQGHSVGLMQLHDGGFGAGLYDLRYDALLNLWHGTKALAEGMRVYSDPALAYARYYNPGGYAQAESVMAKYRWLRALVATPAPGGAR